jgi:hypothetical protein
VQGLQGVQGVQGLQGLQGIQGLQGQIGVQGLAVGNTAPANQGVLWLDTSVTGVVGLSSANFTAKGDTIAGTGSGTFATLPVGANNTILTADSTQTTGVKWSSTITAPTIAYNINAQTSAYTTVLADAAAIITASSGSAFTVSIPTNASVAYPVGSSITIIQTGVGQVTIAAVTSGTTTLNSTGATSATPKLRAQNSSATCIKVATDTWQVVGDIV